MLTRSRRINPRAAIMTACAIAAFTSSCQAPQKMSAEVDEPFEFYIIPDEEILEAEAYWTSEDAVSNDPMPIPEVEPEELFGIFGDNLELLSTQPTGSYIAEHREVNMSEDPWSFGGRLVSDGPPCTAQFVEFSNVLLTAAHCVQNSITGEYRKIVAIKRGYRDHLYDELLFAKCIYTPPQWVTGKKEGDWRYDWAVVTTKTDSNSGHYRIRSGLRSPNYVNWGYAVRYGGTQRAHSVNGRLGTKAEGVAQLLGSRLNDGASGGAWIGGVGSNNYAAGVNAFTIRGRPERGMFSPIFDDTIIGALDRANTCAGQTLVPAPPR